MDPKKIQEVRSIDPRHIFSLEDEIGTDSNSNYIPQDYG